MASKVVLTVGTKKGLFLLTSDADRDKWDLNGPFLNGNDINHATIDPRDGSLYATANDAWFGMRVAASPDLGETWREDLGTPKFPDGGEQGVERLWRIEPGREDEPGVLYCGVDPARCSAPTTAARPGRRTTPSTATRRATAGSPAPAA